MGSLFDLIVNLPLAPAVNNSLPTSTPAPQGTTAPATHSATNATDNPRSFILTAATATHEWRHARDRYMGHLMACRACHAPTKRYCPTGTDLLRTYELTPYHNQIIPVRKDAVRSEVRTG